MADTQDENDIAALTRTFFAAFASGPDVGERLDALADLFVPGAVIVRTCGGEPTVYDVRGFIAPRRTLLTAGQVTEFGEWEVSGRTEIFGDIAHRFSTYAKAWMQDGRRHTGRGAKTVQFVRTGAGWRISGVAWDDVRDGVPGHRLESLEATMNPELDALRDMSEAGDSTATDELIELAAERGDVLELRRLADQGSATAVDQLIETAAEHGHLGELRHLAEQGNSDAAEVLAELTDAD